MSTFVQVAGAMLILLTCLLLYYGSGYFLMAFLSYIF